MITTNKEKIKAFYTHSNLRHFFIKIGNDSTVNKIQHVKKGIGFKSDDHCWGSLPGGICIGLKPGLMKGGGGMPGAKPGGGIPM